MKRITLPLILILSSLFLSGCPFATTDPDGAKQLGRPLEITLGFLGATISIKLGASQLTPQQVLEAIPPRIGTSGFGSRELTVDERVRALREAAKNQDLTRREQQALQDAANVLLRERQQPPTLRQ